MTVASILLILGAYLLGAVPAAYLAAKWRRGIDLRQYGSGNIGATNLSEATSKWIAVLVIVFDLGKGMVPVWAAQQIGLGLAEQVAGGLAAIAGHNWPVFLHFSGGRGVATTIGVVTILPSINGFTSWGIVVFLAIAGVGYFIGHNSPLGIITGVAAMPLVSWVVGEPLVMTLGFLAMFLIVIARRLTAPRTLITASVPLGQLFVNRLLLDRDIRDREVWLHRTAEWPGPKEKTKGR